jgi:dTDP-4-dehydrorhamnose reductase
MTRLSRVMVTGAAGQLGSAVVARMRQRCEVVALTRADLDIADDGAALAAARAASPDAIVNCAAYNDVDGAEDAPAACFNGNAFGVRALARAAAATGAAFVHFGTDFVFDGRGERPYEETDRPGPLSTYGTAKLLGEWFALEAPGAYVLRVESLFGGRPAKSSIDKILKAVEQDQPVRVFSDRTVTPSYVDDVALATERLLEQRPASGVFHCVNSGVTTWLGVAEEVARLTGRRPEIVPVKSADVKLRAMRPQYCALSNAKLSGLGIVMPAWQDALRRHITSVR